MTGAALQGLADLSILVIAETQPVQPQLYKADSLEALARSVQEFFRVETLLVWAEKAVITLGLIFLAYLSIRVANILIERAFDEDARRTYMEPARAVTLKTLLKSVVRYVVDFVAFLTILSTFGVPTQNILAGAGILGLAVGFGAQNLVRDVITGFFVLFEDQFSVGDYIEGAGVSGIVEEMGLRVTKIRDFSGALHMVPNGVLEQVTNFSRGDMRVLFDVGVSYEDNVDEVIELLEKVCEEYAAEEPMITEGPRILGVSELADSSVNLQVWAKTRPMEQWRVARELRKRIKKALDDAGIEIPYPRRVLVPPETTKVGTPFRLRSQDGAGSSPGISSNAQDAGGKPGGT